MKGFRFWAILAAILGIAWGVRYIFHGQYHEAGLHMSVAFWAARYAAKEDEQ